jgi:hypothetical protein
MTLFSASSFDKAQINKLKKFVLEELIKDSFQVHINSCTIKNSNGLSVHTEIGTVTPDGVVYLKVGDYLFLDSRIEPMLKSRLTGEVLRKVIFINEFKAFLNYPSNLLYTLTELVAINDIDLKGEVILDLGCAEGVLGLLALKKGASQVIGVDINKEVAADFQTNLELNGVWGDRSRLIMTEFADRDLILKSLDPDRIDVVFANIGPHFGTSDLEALSLLRFLPNVKTVVGAGYNFGDASLRQTRALIKLGKFDFNKKLKYYYPEGSFHLSFVVER